MNKESGDPEYTFAGEGHGKVQEILTELYKMNYKGFVAIEPHICKVFHQKSREHNPEKEYKMYLDYGRKFEDLIDNLRC